MKTAFSDWYPIVRRAVSRWDRHSAPTLSAAMAFYVLISIAPLSVIAVGLVGRVLGEAEVREYVVETAERVFDVETAQLLTEILDTPWVRRSDPVGTLFAVLMLAFASTAGFNHLRGSLNQIFESPPPEVGPVKGLLRGRALAFLVVLVFGATILASLVMRTVLVAIASVVEMLDMVTTLPWALFAFVEVLVALAILTLLFATVFRLLPDRKLPWRPLFVGASTTSVLFLLGEWIIGQYLGRVGMASAFGVAGSSVVLAAWVYYSSMVFFLGASVTCVYTEYRTGEVSFPQTPEPS
jgi:membrane protein